MTTFSTTHAGLERLLAGTRFLSDAFAPVFAPASPAASLKRLASRVSQSVLQWAERHAQSRADEAYWRIARSFCFWTSTWATGWDLNSWNCWRQKKIPGAARSSL